jgi:ribosomal protein L37AE/L43A
MVEQIECPNCGRRQVVAVSSNSVDCVACKYTINEKVLINTEDELETIYKNEIDE